MESIQVRRIYGNNEIKLDKTDSLYKDLKWRATTTLDTYEAGCLIPRPLKVTTFGGTKIEAMEKMARSLVRKTKKWMAYEPLEEVKQREVV